MKIFFISALTLLCLSLSDILFCNERKAFTERAPLYRSEGILGILNIFRILSIPLILYLGILNWKALIIVFLISLIGMRLFIDRVVEKFIILPITSILNKRLTKKGKNI
jgi:hypothetical protein